MNSHSNQCHDTLRKIATDYEWLITTSTNSKSSFSIRINSQWSSTITINSQSSPTIRSNSQSSSTIAINFQFSSYVSSNAETNDHFFYLLLKTLRPIVWSWRDIVSKTTACIDVKGKSVKREKEKKRRRKKNENLQAIWMRPIGRELPIICSFFALLLVPQKIICRWFSRI